MLGPVIGGWLTEHYSWRYVFYINLPIGIVALIGMMVFLPDEARPGGKLDWFGFGTLSLAVGALQLMLDRGEIKDWFSSGEIVIEAIVAGSALYLFLVHTFTADRPFLRPALFRDRNFATGTVFMAVVGLTLYASMALQPSFLQGSWTIRSRPRGWSWGRAALAQWSPCWLSDDWWGGSIPVCCSARASPSRRGRSM